MVDEVEASHIVTYTGGRNYQAWKEESDPTVVINLAPRDNKLEASASATAPPSG
jgi:hypothetical protein